MSSGHSKHGIGSRAQIAQEVCYSIEWLFSEVWIGSELWKQKVIGSHHVADRGRRADQLRQNEVKRPAHQGKAVGRQWKRQAKLGKNDSMALQNQGAAVHQRTVKVENDKLHSIFCSYPGRYQGYAVAFVLTKQKL